MRKVFFSFDWDDVLRANQVSNSLAEKGHYKAAGFTDVAQVEKARKQSDREIRKWIDGQLTGTSVTCVLIGNRTNKSKWVKYEIEKSIKKKNGLVGVLIHELKGVNSCMDGIAEHPFKGYNQTGCAMLVKNALLGRGAGWGLSKLLFPQLAIGLTVFGTALAMLEPKDDYRIYDWVEDNGDANLGNWIEEAAKQVGR